MTTAAGLPRRPVSPARARPVRSALREPLGLVLDGRVGRGQGVGVLASVVSAEQQLSACGEEDTYVRLGTAAVTQVQGGQRLGLAGALLTGPDVLILDEPANGLDPQGIRWLRELLRGLAAEGAAVLVSSHILAEVAQTADSVVIIDHGRLVAQAPLADLLGGSHANASLEEVFFELTHQHDGGSAVPESDGAAASDRSAR